MPAKTPKARASTRNDGWKIWAPAVLLALTGFFVAAQFVGPAPPRNLVLATGPEGGAYHRFGLAYQEALAENGIELQLQLTAGSLENLDHLLQGTADVAFVQGGTAPDDERLEGIASLYYEPLWVFHRDGFQLARLSGLQGLRIQVGERGSGTRSVAEELLSANRVTAENSTFFELPPADAARALMSGEIDALLLVSAPESETVQQLMDSEGDGYVLLDMARDRSYTQIFRYLQGVVLGEGVLDLARNVPDRSLHLVSPTASLIATDELHAALAPLFIEAARTIHGRGGLFEDEGQFPSTHGLDAPPSRAARHDFANGPSFLYRVLPFRTAAMLDRLKIMLLPMLTLLFPLMKIAPPAYRWRIRSKIYRWYKVLHDLEHDVFLVNKGKNVEAAIAELDRIEMEILEVRVPPSYAEELYNLRMHLDLVLERVRELRQADEA
jgi:hypothetical protein